VIRHALAFACACAALGAGADPRTDYMLHCQGCHRADGGGAPGSVPDLRDTLGALLRAPGGRGFLVQVPGSRNAPLDDARLAAVLNWMVVAFSARTLPADFVPYAHDEVARLRAAHDVDVVRLRARLNDAISSSTSAGERTTP
jgi:hypothetical protein